MTVITTVASSNMTPGMRFMLRSIALRKNTETQVFIGNAADDRVREIGGSRRTLVPVMIELIPRMRESLLDWWLSESRLSLNRS